MKLYLYEEKDGTKIVMSWKNRVTGVDWNLIGTFDGEIDFDMVDLDAEAEKRKEARRVTLQQTIESAKQELEGLE